MSADLYPQIDTPALLVDVDVLEQNLEKMAAFVRNCGVTTRPHFKSHRIDEICRRQRLAGARGITCAKLAEAELLAELGMDHLLVANQVVGPHKWQRLAKLARRNKVTVGVDNLEVARQMAAAAREQHSTVGFLVEVNLGMNRCGVDPGRSAVELALRCSELKGLRFRGVMGYEGHCCLLPRDEKVPAIQEAVGKLTETAQRCTEAGLEVKVVSCGGTGTYDVTARCPGVTELQTGTYALMDLLFHEDGGADFDYACTVLSTVISRPAEDRAITDAGRKSIHPSFGNPRPLANPGVTVTALNSEHGVLHLEDEGRNLQPGDRLQLIPYYLEGTTNLFEKAYAVSNGEVLGEWKVSGRGLSQ